MAERKKRPAASRLREREDERGYDADDDLVGPRSVQAPRLRRGNRGGGDRESLPALVRDVPHFLKLLVRLARDPRVSTADKAIVAGAVAYFFIPADAIPDWIPALGEIEDIFLLGLALSRLLNNAGTDVLMDHWDGDVASLEAALSMLDRAGRFLPEPIRGMVGGRR